MIDKPEENPPILPFVIIALFTCIAGYPVAVVLKLLSLGRWSALPEVLCNTATVFGCCWVLFAVALWIAFRTWRLWHR